MHRLLQHYQKRLFELNQQSYVMAVHIGSTGCEATLLSTTGRDGMIATAYNNTDCRGDAYDQRLAQYVMDEWDRTVAFLRLASSSASSSSSLSHRQRVALRRSCEQAK